MRTARLLLLAAGLTVVGVLVWHAGPRLILDMLLRVGWRVPIVAAIFALYLATRALALWRSVPCGSLRYSDVLRIRLSGDAIEVLTFSGPFVAEPAKGWLLAQSRLAPADAFAAVATEYLLYNVVTSFLAAGSVSTLLIRGALGAAGEIGAIVVLAVAIAFLAACVYASVSGTGVIVPILRSTRIVIGQSRAAFIVEKFTPIEERLVTLLHSRHVRLAELLAIESASQVLLMSEIRIVLAALGTSASWGDAFLIEGAVKFIGAAFPSIPGQVGAAEGVYELLAAAVGFPAQTGLTLALVRRLRSVLVAVAGLIVLARFETREPEVT